MTSRFVRTCLTFLGWLPAAVQVCGIGLVVITGVLCSIVYDRSYYDDACAHIPIAVDMARHWNPYYVDPQQPFVAHWYPGLAETIVALIIGVTGSLRFSNSTGIAAFLGILLMTWKAAGLWTRDVRTKVSCLAMVAATPVFLAQTTAFYNDIHLALFALAVLYFMARCYATRQALHGYCSLAGIALIAGTKYYGLYYALVLTPVVAYCLWRCRRPRVLHVPLVATAACVLFSTGFYVRNLLTRGNPFYPIHVPPGLRHVVEALTLFNVPYEELPDIFNSPATRLPHPLIPDSLTARLTPDVTSDAFGLAFPVGLALTLFSLLLLRRIPSRLGRPWSLMLMAALVLIAVFPFHLSVPRYMCVSALIVSLAPAVLDRAWAGSQRGAGWCSRPAAGWVVNACTAGVLFAFVWPSVLAPPVGARAALATVREAYRQGRTIQMTQIPLPSPGHHLRLGYVGGFNNFVSLLYDDHFSNQLFPLYFKQSPFHALPRDVADEQAFVEQVKSLNLDGIHIFHRKNPAGPLVQKYFGDKLF